VVGIDEEIGVFWVRVRENSNLGLRWMIIVFGGWIVFGMKFIVLVLEIV